MEKFLGQEFKESDRRQFLDDNCDIIEEIGYTRRFTTDELKLWTPTRRKHFKYPFLYSKECH